MTALLLKIWRILSLPKGVQISIMRLFQDQFLIGVSGVIFDEHDQILLFKHSYRRTAWGLPGGYLKAKEHPVNGLEREIEEESGLMISIDDKLRINLDKDSSCLDISYVGTFIGGEFKSSDEVIDFGFFNLENLPLLPKKQLLIVDKAFKYKHMHRKLLIVTAKPEETENSGFISRLKQAINI
ncbi:NUDIX domain-containing protein [Patescibacteria group bacterium]|nr:NUDIX domain-containing protein [Patescibacteria group bacterium]MCL5797405.1 NUDIX domain-containing protein [Patescibacteria group bacterium]